MHYAWPRNISANSAQRAARVVQEVPRQGIDECARFMRARWMHNQPGLLVDDNEMLILIQNVERNVLGCKRVRGRRG